MLALPKMVSSQLITTLSGQPQMQTMLYKQTDYLNDR